MPMKLVSNEISGNPEAATEIRKIADMVERGEVRDIVIAYDKRDEKVFAKWGMFADRWRLLGALEYAKSVALDG